MPPSSASRTRISAKRSRPSSSSSTGSRATTTLERTLIAFCREHLAHFKCPRSVDFVDELPRLPTGKLYKGVLREQYWASHDTRIV